MNNVYNVTPQNLIHWRKALGNVRSGSANARIMCVGDSTTYGVGSTGQTTGTHNYIQLSWPSQLSALFNAAGVNATWQSFVGDQGPPGSFVNMNGVDLRLTAGSGWGPSGETIGGSTITNNSTTNTLSFVPVANVDSFRIFYIDGAGSSFTYNIDGGSPVTVTQAGTGLLKPVTSTAVASIGAHTLNVNRVSGTTTLTAIEAFNSTISQVLIDNCGWSSSTSTNWNDPFGAGSPATAATWTSYAPDLVVVNLGINDWVAGTSAATYITNIQAIITAIKGGASCDIILMTPVPTNTTNASIANQQSLITAMRSLAQANNLPLIDMWARWQSYAVSQPLGYYADTFTHPIAFGYSDNASFIANALLGT